MIGNDWRVEKMPEPPTEEELLKRERMLKWFAHEHLREPAKSISSTFAILARTMVLSIPSGPERTVALRKLLEAKDAAVRAVIHPGG